MRERVVGNEIYIEKLTTILQGKFYMDFTWYIYNDFTTNLGKLKHIEYTFSPKYNGNMIRCNVDVMFMTISLSTYLRSKHTWTLRRNTFVVNCHGVYDEIFSRRNCVVKTMQIYEEIISS